MRCPKCGALIPRRRMVFSDVFRGFNCESCSTALQATYLSRLTLIGLSFVAAGLCRTERSRGGRGRHRPVAHLDTDVSWCLPYRSRVCTAHQDPTGASA